MSSRIYPLWRTVCEEKVCGTNKVDEYRIEIQYDEGTQWTSLYTADSLPQVQLALKRLKDLYNPIIENIFKGKEPVMFEVDGYVYSTECILPFQSCIVGNYIDNNIKYDDKDDDIVKYDYLTDYVSFYYNGDVLVKANQVFLNGKLIIDFLDLKDICNAIGQDIDSLDYNADNLIKYIANNYPDAVSYTCKGFTRFDIRS